MALRHRNSSNVWSEWFRILHSDNIGSYALTLSNYTSTLDSRYVKKAGDTMTGQLLISVTDVPLSVDSAGSIETQIHIKRNGAYKAAFGYYNGLGVTMFNWTGGYYLNLTDGGGLQLSTKSATIGNIWHSGNDGSGSGLDADLLDGYQASSFLLKSGGTMTGKLNVKAEIDSAGHSVFDTSSLSNVRLSLNWSGGVARIYAITNDGNTYKDLSLGQTPGNNASLYFDASAACWGIGTSSPAYKLDVSGDIRTSGYLRFSRNGVDSRIASENSSWLHFYTSASTGFYFDKLVSVNGDFYIYKSSGRLFIPSSEGNQKYYIRIE